MQRTTQIVIVFLLFIALPSVLGQEHKDHDHSATESSSNHHDSSEASDVENHEETKDRHDHSAHADSSMEQSPHLLSKIITWFGKFHPPTVHFPIALLIASAIAELLFIFTKNTLFDHASRFCVSFGMIGAIAASILGWFFGGFHLSDTNWIMTTHRWFGTSTAIVSVILLWLSEVSRKRRSEIMRYRFRVLLFISATLVSVTGFFGGAMIYGIDHFNW